uniref:Uncharacterized protein n=2 Tax=Oryza sativa subsp. japonica TaxID=39947 RepID=Q6YXE8_ORYSJ|nr:hypothetical protein [Oryza sativa Japonica Group]BAC92644.1 hypothetical protein [Oryza sativa Japonica Group]
MHLDGPKLHAIASESRPGQAPDMGEITRRMDTLDMETGEIQYNLTEHIAQTQEWQQSANAQFANINNMMQ